MFGSSKTASSTFLMMLGEALLRHALEELYPGLQYFERDVTAEKYRTSDVTETEIERRLKCAHTGDEERLVKMTLIVGPFEPLGYENDLRGRLRRVKGECRMFSVEGAVTHWRPHYLDFGARDDADNVVLNLSRKVYETGLIHGMRFEQNSENPCAAMIASQASLRNPVLHGRKPKITDPGFIGRERHLELW